MKADGDLIVQIFFPGQKILVKRNINTPRRITNGAIGYDHSIVMSDLFTEHDKYEFDQRVQATLPGQICWLKTPPAFRNVTVSVENVNDPTWPLDSIKSGRDSLNSDEIVPGDIIVPIPAMKVLDGTNLTQKPRVGFSRTIGVVQHSVQPAQAFTDFNIQGSTCKAVLLYMYKGAKPSVSFETMYVAMTRGSGAKSIRWIPPPIGTSLSFLCGLKPSINLKVWRNCYDSAEKFQSTLARTAALAFKLITATPSPATPSPVGSGRSRPTAGPPANDLG